MKKRQDKWRNVLDRNELIAWLWLAVAYAWDVWYHVFRGEGMLDSDMASEMVLADILNKEHALTCLTTSWNYSSEVRFLHMQWFYRLGLLLFPHRWHAARIIGIMLGLLVLAAAAISVFYAAGLKKEGIWAAALCLLPGGNWYFWQTLYSGVYLPYIYFSLFTMALILRAEKNRNSPKRKIDIALILILGLSSGLNGVKQLMVFYAPLVLAAVFHFIYEVRTAYKDGQPDKDTKKSYDYMIFAILGTVSSVVGYGINSRILSSIYHFKSYNEVEITPSSFWEMFKEYIWSFGYVGGKPLLSVTGIASMCGVLFGLLVIFSGVRVLWRFASLSTEEKWIAVVAVSSILFNIFILSMIEWGGMQYYQATVPMGILLVVLEIKTEDFVFSQSRFIIRNLTVFILATASLGTILNESSVNQWPYHNYRAQPALHVAVDALRDMGYTQGISEFWTANMITELSNGEIDMWSVLKYTDEDYYAWLQKEDHLGHDPQGRFFLIMKLDDEIAVEEYAVWQRHTDLQYIYSDDVYIVYGN